MIDVTIYTKDDCPYCKLAKQFFESRSIPYKEKYVGTDITSEEYRETINNTVPGIFINNEFIGGYNDLVWLSGIAPRIFDER